MISDIEAVKESIATLLNYAEKKNDFNNMFESNIVLTNEIEEALDLLRR